MAKIASTRPGARASAVSQRRRSVLRAMASTLTSARSALLLASAATAPSVFAQDSYPNRPVTMIVPFPPGGVADLVGRPVAAALERSLGQAVVVENKAGAGGGIGMAAAARAKPDGYTLLYALSSISILPEADKVLERAPLYQLQQLLPIARFTADPVILVVRSDSRWTTWAELLSDARARPGTITYGSSGNYGTMHVPVEALAQHADMRLLHVPYAGAGPAIVGLLSGQVDIIAAGPSAVLGQIKAGKMRALAGWGANRVAALPDVPTLTELGHPVRFSQWSGLFAPTGAPPTTIERLRSAARAVLADEKFQQAMATLHTPVQFMDSDEFQRFYYDDAKVQATVVRRIGKVE